MRFGLKLRQYGPLLRFLEVAAVYAIGFAVASAALALTVVLLEGDPIGAFTQMLNASFGSLNAFTQTLNKTTPLLLGAIGVAFCLRAGYFNIGIDGQIYGGALLAVAMATYLGSGFPRALTVVAVLLASIFGGALVAAIPAVLRARWGVNEIFTTVMFNFIVFYLALYFAAGPWTDPVSGEPITTPIPFEARLPKFLTPVGHVGIFIAIAAALLMGSWLRRTRRGFGFRAAGVNPLATQFAGVNLVAVGVIAIVFGGMLGGLAGGIEVSGVHGRLIMGFTPNYGLLAVLIAVVARGSLVAIIPISLAFGTLLIGVDSLQRTIRLPAAAVLLIVGLLVLTVLFLGSRAKRAFK